MPEWNIATRLENAASEWNVLDKYIVALVYNNVSNIRLVAKEVGWERIS